MILCWGGAAQRSIMSDILAIFYESVFFVEHKIDIE